MHTVKLAAPKTPQKFSAIITKFYEKLVLKMLLDEKIGLYRNIFAAPKAPRKFLG